MFNLSIFDLRTFSHPPNCDLWHIDVKSTIKRWMRVNYSSLDTRLFILCHGSFAISICRTPFIDWNSRYIIHRKFLRYVVCVRVNRNVRNTNIHSFSIIIKVKDSSFSFSIIQCLYLAHLRTSLFSYDKRAKRAESNIWKRRSWKLVVRSTKFFKTRISNHHHPHTRAIENL